MADTITMENVDSMNNCSGRGGILKPKLQNITSNGYNENSFSVSFNDEINNNNDTIVLNHNNNKLIPSSSVSSLLCDEGDMLPASNYHRSQLVKSKTLERKDPSSQYHPTSLNHPLFSNVNHLNLINSIDVENNLLRAILSGKETLSLTGFLLDINEDLKRIDDELLKRSTLHKITKNNDNKYPEAVPPGKVEPTLCRTESYDVPSTDDGDFYYGDWYMKEEKRWSKLADKDPSQIKSASYDELDVSTITPISTPGEKRINISQNLSAAPTRNGNSRKPKIREDNAPFENDLLHSVLHYVGV